MKYKKTIRIALLVGITSGVIFGGALILRSVRADILPSSAYDIGLQYQLRLGEPKQTGDEISIDIYSSNIPATDTTYYLPVSVIPKTNVAPGGDQSLPVSACDLPNCRPVQRQQAGSPGDTAYDYLSYESCVPMPASGETERLKLGTFSYSTRSQIGTSYDLAVEFDKLRLDATCQGAPAVNTDYKEFSRFRMSMVWNPNGSPPRDDERCSYTVSGGQYNTFDQGEIACDFYGSQSGGANGSPLGKQPEKRNDDNNNDGKGAGATIGGGGGGGGSSGANNQSGITPVSSPQGETQQPPKQTPSPFYDGKLYANGIRTDLADAGIITKFGAAEPPGKWVLGIATVVLFGIAGVSIMTIMRNRHH